MPILGLQPVTHILNARHKSRRARPHSDKTGRMYLPVYISIGVKIHLFLPFCRY